MLPSSKSYLVRGGYSPQAAAWMLIGLFLVGVIGIQILSRALHHFIPSHVVDCDHTHDEEEGDGEEDDDHGEMEEQPKSPSMGQNAPPIFKISASEDSEDTPLLSRDATGISPPKPRTRSSTLDTEAGESYTTAPSTRRPSVLKPLRRKFTSFVQGAKATCDEDGHCQGYSEPCGQECFKALNRRSSSFSHTASRHPTFYRSATTSQISKVPPVPEDEEDQHLHADEASRGSSAHVQQAPQFSRSRSSHTHHPPSYQNGDADPQRRGISKSDTVRSSRSVGTANTTGTAQAQHHHHVPTNAFLSIGLQTSLAIALHKLPEGFITYATNHANPTLGFSVFMALFIHNITEGFAMALPLYLALNSRFQAMFWSSLLGGVSQPLGAGIAALWFKLAGGGNMAPGERVYGGMFAVTAGIMTSVALQLFSESLGLTHNRNMCIVFAFAGMAILGISFALTA